MALILGGAALGVWLERNAIGERVVLDYLSRRGVAARVHITRLDADRVEGALELGPASRPTLIVRRFSAEFTPTRGLAAPRLKRLDLIEPVLTARFDGRRFDFGALQALIDDALRGPKSLDTPPDIAVSGGRVNLATPYGPVSGGVDGALEKGALKTVRLSLQPSTFRWTTTTAQRAAGILKLAAVSPGRYALDFDMRAERLRSGGATLDRPTLIGRMELPFDPSAGVSIAGPVRFTADCRAAALRSGDAAGRSIKLHLEAAGVATGPASLAFEGTGSAQGAADAARVGQGTAASPRFTLAASQLSYFARNGLSMAGEAKILASKVRTPVSGRRLSLTKPSLSVQGEARSAPDRSLTAQGRLSFAAAAGLPAREAQSLAEQAAPGVYGAELRPAIARPLTASVVSIPAARFAVDREGARLSLDSPARVTWPGRGALIISDRGPGWTLRAARGGVSGRGVLALAGDGFPTLHASITRFKTFPGGLDLDFGGKASGSAGPLRDASAFLSGAISTRGEEARLSLASCANVSLQSFVGEDGKPLVQGAILRACPTAGSPAAVLTPRGWRLATDLHVVALSAPAADLALADAEAGVRLSGQSGQISGEITVSRAIVTDVSKPLRFRPLAVAGPLRLEADRLSGDLALALAKPARPLGRLTLTQDLRSGAGGLEVRTQALVFVQNDLQPAAILPALASLGTAVTGSVESTFNLAWQGGGTSARVHVVTPGLQLKTPAGLAKGVATDLTLTRLDPLTTPPDQRITVRRLESVVPLTDVSATFAMANGELRLAAVDAALADGRVSLDPMRIGLKPGAIVDGVVRLDGVQLAPVLETLNLSRALHVQARLSGALPFSLGPQGLRFQGGRLAATGGGRLSVVREALSGVSTGGGASAQAPSAGQDLAYQALEDLAFDSLDADVDSRPGGRLGVLFHIKGRHDPAIGRPAVLKLSDLLRGRAFQSSIPLPKGTGINLTLDSSLNLDELIGSASGLAAKPGSAQVHK